MIIPLFWIILGFLLFLIVITIYFGFISDPPTYEMPKNIPPIKLSKNPISYKIKKEKPFQEFLKEEGCISIFPELSVRILARSKFTQYADSDMEIPEKNVISTLPINSVLHLPFPTRFACNEFYISSERKFIAFYSMFDCKIFAIRFNDIIRIKREPKDENCIWIECWLKKTLVEIRIDANKGGDLVYNSLSNHPILKKLFNSNQKKVLAIYNPVSGLLKSKSIVHDIEYMYNYLGIIFEKKESQYAGHVKDIIKELATTESFDDIADPSLELIEGIGKLREYNAILSIGGDGTLYEIVNALHETNVHLPKLLPVVPVPGGTGNGVVSSLYGVNADHLLPARSVLLNEKWILDAMRINLKQKKKSFLGLMSTTLGIIADADIESEFLRFLGDLRFVIYGFLLIFLNRGYPLKVTMSIDENFQSVKQTVEVNNQDEITLSGKYLSLFVGKMSYLSKDFIGFDQSFPDDGYIDVVLIPRTYNIFKTVMQFAALFAGTISVDPNLHYFKTKKIKVEPDLSYRPNANVVFDGEAQKITSYSCEIIPEAYCTLKMH